MPVLDYTPTVKEVAAILHARTTSRGGGEAGTFTANTRPTQEQVEEVIKDIVQECYTSFGQDIPDSKGDEKDALRNAAKRVVAMGVAAEIEISYFPEQVATQRSPYKMYQERYQEGVKKISRAVADLESGAEPGTDDNAQLALSEGFPVDVGGMVGWDTLW